MNAKRPLISWDSLPANLEVLKELLVDYEKSLVELRAPRFLDDLPDNTNQILEIRTRLNGVWNTRIAQDLRDWVDSSRAAKPSIRSSAFYLEGLLLFVFLTKDVGNLVRDATVLSDLPEVIRQLAIKWHLESEGDIAECVRGLTIADLAELKAAGRELRSKVVASCINQTLDRHPLDECAESAWLYFLWMLIDEVGCA